MENIYKIYSVYLYDDQLNHDYLILYNRRESFLGGPTNELPYTISMVLRDIYNDKSYSVEKMKRACDNSNLLFVKNDGYLKPIFREPTRNPRYSIYDIYWNETKSNIDISKYDLCAIWNEGGSSYSSYRIYETFN